MKKLSYLLIMLLVVSLMINGVNKISAFTNESIVSDTVEASNKGILEEACFFGDSTTHGLIRYNVENTGIHGKNYRTLQRAQVWTPQCGTFYLGNLFSTEIALADGSCLSLKNACSRIHPKYLIITVGINGLRSWTEESFTRYYEKMLDVIATASPKTEIILQSVFPVAKERSADLADFTMEKINRLNGWIQSIAKDRKLCFLNTSSALCGEDGHLNPSYHNGDGLHLNTQGFNAVLCYIENNYNAR